MAEPAEPYLHARLPVRADSPEAFDGTLGLLVYDEGVDQVLALTAAQLAAGVRRFLHGATPVATLSHNLLAAPVLDAESPAGSLVAPLIVDEARPLSQQQLLDQGGKAVPAPVLADDLPRLLGEEVLVQVAAGPPRRAVLHSLNGQFNMPVGNDREPIFFHSALELGSLDGAPVTKAGDAGAVVSTLDGNPIGIVICGFEDVSFAARLDQLPLGEGAWEPVSATIAKRWNERVARDGGVNPRAFAMRTLLGRRAERAVGASEDGTEEGAEWDAIARENDRELMIEWSRHAPQRYF